MPAEPVHRVLELPSHCLHFTVREAVHGESVARRTVLLGHALGCDVSMWDALASELSALQYRVVCYDHRGHGLSGVPASEAYAMAELADDAARLIEHLGQGPVSFIGLSLGGMVAQELALRRPDLINALVLANTASEYDVEARRGWAQRIERIRHGGLVAVVDMALERWFHAGFRVNHPEEVAQWRERILATDATAYIAHCQAIAGVATTQRLRQVQVPSLVIAGELDVGTPPAMVRLIASEIPDAQWALLPDASHFSVLEQPRVFASLVIDWLNRIDVSADGLCRAL